MSISSEQFFRNFFEQVGGTDTNTDTVEGPITGETSTGPSSTSQSPGLSRNKMIIIVVVFVFLIAIGLIVYFTRDKETGEREAQDERRAARAAEAEAEAEQDAENNNTANNTANNPSNQSVQLTPQQERYCNLCTSKANLEAELNEIDSLPGTRALCRLPTDNSLRPSQEDCDRLNREPSIRNQINILEDQMLDLERNNSNITGCSMCPN